MVNIDGLDLYLESSKLTVSSHIKNKQQKKHFCFSRSYAHREWLDLRFSYVSLFSLSLSFYLKQSEAKLTLFFRALMAEIPCLAASIRAVTA